MWVNLLFLTLLVGGAVLGMWRAMRKPAFVSLADQKPVMDRDSVL
jgi:hypothetical protein